ncbi:hypothetical protein E2C01_031820 [Portunus trituberculatus]|uniref:Uncharacterized protein n=1 Tax=Portunus trituberculatus TaxID=210409 RepID=A0A5B7EXZ2_PORTR|nr:hypothetical protein [Portunus trituberculatus]
MIVEGTRAEGYARITWSRIPATACRATSMFDDQITGNIAHGVDLPSETFTTTTTNPGGAPLNTMDPVDHAILAFGFYAIALQEQNKRKRKARIWTRSLSTTVFQSREMNNGLGSFPMTRCPLKIGVFCNTVVDIPDARHAVASIRDCVIWASV